MKTKHFLVLLMLLAGGLLSACNAQNLNIKNVSIDQTNQSATAEFSGVVESIAADTWRVSGVDLIIDANTIIDGTFQVGDQVKVTATATADGKITANKIEADVADPSETPSDTPEVSATPEVSETPASSETPEATTTLEMTVTPGVPCSSEVDDDADEDNQAGIPQVTATPEAGATMSVTPAVNCPSDDDRESENDHHQNKITGKLESMDNGVWVVKGMSFITDANTMILDNNILVGDVVKIQYRVNADGTFTALSIGKAGKNQGHNSEKNGDNHFSGTPQPQNNPGQENDDDKGDD